MLLVLLASIASYLPARRATTLDPVAALRFPCACCGFRPACATSASCRFRTIDQFTDAGTAIGSNLSEAQSAITRKRMARYYSIALGDARETTTWLRVLQAVPHGDPAEVAWLLQEASEFVAMLTVSVKKLRNPPS